jgi:hypothetical protein
LASGIGRISVGVPNRFRNWVSHMFSAIRPGIANWRILTIAIALVLLGATMVLAGCLGLAMMDARRAAVG